MAYGGNAYKTLITVEAEKKEVDNASSGFVYTTGKKRTAVSDVGSSNTSISTRKSSITDRCTYMDKGIGSQTFKTDTDTYTGTEICIACLQKKDIKKQATLFCKQCDTHGRYICHSCMLDHNLWTGKDHEVVSLSVDKETDRDWQRQEVQRDDNDYPYIDRWFQRSSSPDDCEYGELNEQDMMTTVGATRSENESDYHLANSDLDEMQRPGMPLPDDYPELYQHSNEHTYENIMSVERAAKSRRRIQMPDASLEMASERDSNTVTMKTERQDINTLDENWMLASRRTPWSPITDGSSQSFYNYDSEESDYDLYTMYNETRNKAKFNPLRNKNKACLLM